MSDEIDENEVDEQLDEGDEEGADPSRAPEAQEGAPATTRRERGRRGRGLRVTAAIEITRQGKPLGSRTACGVRLPMGDSGGDGLDLADSSLRHEHAAIVADEGGAFFVALDDGPIPRLNGAKTAVGVPVPLAEGDRIDFGRTEVAVRQLAVAPADAARYMGVRMIDKCGQCGGPMPLNGPLLNWHCNNCQQATPVEPDYWATALDGLFEEYGEEKGEYTLAFETTVKFATEKPRCGKCAETLPVDEVAVGTRGNVFCPACGAPNPTAPAPIWLRGAYPAAVQLYNAETEDGAGPDAIATPQAARPVMLSCPSCNGGLKITAESERTITCQYCAADVYLPDDLWKRLHPAKIAGMWYVRFDGLSSKEREEERQVRRLFARAAAKLEKQKRRDADAAAKAAAAASAPAPAVKANEERRPPRKRMSESKKRTIMATVTGVVGVVLCAYIFVVNRPAGAGPAWTRVALFPNGATVGQTYFTLQAPFQFAAEQTPQSVTWSSESYGLVVDVSAVAAIPPDGFQAAAMLGSGLTFDTGTAWNDTAGYSGIYRNAGNTVIAAATFRRKAAPVQVAVPGSAEAVAARPVVLCRAIWSGSAAFDDPAGLGAFLREICDSLQVP